MDIVLKPSGKHEESLEKKSLRGNNGKVEEDNGHQGRTMYLICIRLRCSLKQRGMEIHCSHPLKLLSTKPKPTLWVKPYVPRSLSDFGC